MTPFRPVSGGLEERSATVTSLSDTAPAASLSDAASTSAAGTGVPAHGRRPERLFVVVGYDDAELLDIACVTTSLETANRLGARPPYRILLATRAGRASAAPPV
jgi:hypothetical protein